MNKFHIIEGLVIMTLTLTFLEKNYKTNECKEELEVNSINISLLISSEIGVTQKVMDYVKVIDKNILLYYETNQIMEKGQKFEYCLIKKINFFYGKEEEVKSYHIVILGAYSVK